MQFDPIASGIVVADEPVSIIGSALVFALGVYLTAPRQWRNLARRVMERVLRRRSG